MNCLGLAAFCVLLSCQSNMFYTCSIITLTSYAKTVHKGFFAMAWASFNLIRPGRFSRSPGPGGGVGGSKARMPKIKLPSTDLNETLRESLLS